MGKKQIRLKNGIVIVNKCTECPFRDRGYCSLIKGYKLVDITDGKINWSPISEDCPLEDAEE